MWTMSNMFVSLSQLQLHAGQDVVVYDQNSSDPSHLRPESFLSMVLLKLEPMFSTVHLLSGESAWVLPQPQNQSSWVRRTWSPPARLAEVLTRCPRSQGGSWNSPSCFLVCVRGSPSWVLPVCLSPAPPSPAWGRPGSCPTCTWAANGMSSTR